MAKNNLNSVSLSGNLTAAPEIRYGSGGGAILTFTLAVNRKYGEKEDVSFIDVKIFGKLGEAINQYLDKGKGVIVGGRLNQERWQNSEGENRSKVVVIADFIEMTGGQPASGGSPQYTPNPAYSNGPESFSDDRIPF